MKKYIIQLSLTLFSNLYLNAQCNQATNKVLVMGDSWSAFYWQYDSHNTNFDKYGFSDYKAYSTGASISPNSGALDLSQSGAEARNYLTSVKRGVIQSTFANNPNIEFAQLSLGGNDFLNSWDTTWNQTQINTLTAEVMDSVTSVINYLKQLKPNLKILLSAYDYPNFQEAINGSSSHPYFARWNAMNKPRFKQINDLLTQVNTIIKNYALAGSNLYFVDNLGLMQYVYGQTTPLLFSPGGTYAPATVPFPGGNANYPSPLVAMNTYIFIKDAFHLSEDGFNYFVENQVKEFYFNQFRNYDLTTKNKPAESGYVNSTGAFSDTSVVVGNLSNTKHVGLLSFQITNLDITKTVSGVSIFLKRKRLYGSNPIGNYTLTLELKQGDFGNSATPDNADFTAIADATISACQYGSVNANEYWMRLDLPQTVSQQITSNQTYQFRLGLDGNGNNALEFYSDMQTANAPFIDIKYTPVLSVKKQSLSINDAPLRVFPNPIINNKCTVSFTKPFAGVLELYDVLGNNIKSYCYTDVITNTNIVLPTISKGIYFLRAKAVDGKLVLDKKVIVE